MNYLHYKMKAETQHYIKVELNARATIKLLDTLNYFKYQSGKPYEATSEYQNMITIDMKVPFKSTWHVVIEHGDYRGILKANVKVV
ncbi:MAG: DUF1883 domain-containing protein [Spirochaetaceae bacterium]|nr:MAG: DUF1883 domain-containing protein [Spirochaetaceae bacterium]